jgi:hypothetical protein
LSEIEINYGVSERPRAFDSARLSSFPDHTVKSRDFGFRHDRSPSALGNKTPSQFMKSIGDRSRPMTSQDGKSTEGQVQPPAQASMPTVTQQPGRLAAIDLRNATIRLMSRAGVECLLVAQAIRSETGSGDVK